jgi:predicted membrane-bound mannosyltransferase
MRLDRHSTRRPVALGPAHKEACTGCNYWIEEAIAARSYARHFYHKIPILRNLGLVLHIFVVHGE